MEKDHTIGYNFVIRTVARDYRMRADTKSQQIAWARAFTILFEIRARVTKMLLNSSIGVYSGVGSILNSYANSIFSEMVNKD